MQALLAGRHDEPKVRRDALPLIQLAIMNLADDEHMWNALGAERYLRLVGDIAAPLLEIAMATGDSQQRRMAAALLLNCNDVSDTRALAELTVQSLRDDWPVNTVGLGGSWAFHELISSDQLLAASTRFLVQGMDCDDLQLRINAAILLCAAGHVESADRIVEILSPLLDEDDAPGTATTAVSALGWLGVAAIDPIRARLHERDAQGSRLAAHLLYVLAGPQAEGAGRLSERARLELTSLTHVPAVDEEMTRFVDVANGKPRSSSGRMWYMSAGSDVTKARRMRQQRETDYIRRTALDLLCGVTERVARRRLERAIADMTPVYREQAEPLLRAAFEEDLATHGPDHPDPPPFCEEPAPLLLF